MKGSNQLKGVSKMKSIFNYTFALVAIYLLSVGAALAEPALVIGIDGCGLFNGNGMREEGTGVTVSAENQNGNVMHTCSADVEAPHTGRTAIFNFDNTKIKCGIDNGFGGDLEETEDWHEVVTKKGKAKLICHFHF